MTEREQFEKFEAWFRAVYIKRGYVSSKEELREAWQAARATPAIPDTHRVVSVEDLCAMQWAFEDHRAGFMVDKIRAIIEDKP